MLGMTLATVAFGIRSCTFNLLVTGGSQVAQISISVPGTIVGERPSSSGNRKA